jgi:hypothetical protein
MKIAIQRLILTIVTSAFVSIAFAEDDLVSVGYGGISAATNNSASINASAFGLQYEHKISDLISVTGGLAHLNYTVGNSNSGSLAESGNGTGLFVDANFYPGKNSNEGFYVGPGIGLTAISSSWSQNVRGTIYSGSADTNVYDVHGKLGWKIKTGSVVIDPNFRFGYFINAPTSGTSANRSLGGYMLIGVNVGMPF